MIRWHLALALVIALFLLTSCTATQVTNVHIERVLVNVNVTGNGVEVRP